VTSAGTRNNILAGAFLLAGVALAVWGSFVLGGRTDTAGTTPYRFYFTLADGASGIQPGSPVHMGGQEVGLVVSVDPVTGTDAQGNELPTGWDLRVRVRSNVPLYANAVVTLERPLLGSMSSVNIVSVGGPEQPGEKRERLAPGEAVTGMPAPPAFLAQAGFGPEQRDRIRRIIADAENAVASVRRMVDESGPLLQGSLEGLRAMVEEAHAKWPGWLERVDALTVDLSEGGSRVSAVMDEAEATVKEARSAAESLRATVDENRAQFDSIVDNADRASARLAGPTVGELEKGIAQVQATLERFRGLVADAGDVLAEQTPNVRKAMANLRLMSDQLRLMAVEVRSQPWRLLVRPDTKELEQQLLYDSARSYASAVSDLRAVSESLEAMARRQAPEGGVEGEELADLRSRLREAFAEYQRREQELLDRLIKGR